MELVNFNFSDFIVRTMKINDEPWFIAKDVCAVLNISNSSDALSRLDDDEKGLANADTLRGTQEMAVINESGLYSLILTSRKPEAKAFKKWVTSEVLPSIRKTGIYQSENSLPRFQVPDTLAGALRLAADQAETIEKQTLLIEQQKPAVEFVSRYVEAKSTKAISDVAKILGVKQSVFIAWLVKRQYIFKRSGGYLPYSTCEQYFEVKTGEAHGHAYHQTKFTPSGIEWISRKWIDYSESVK